MNERTRRNRQGRRTASNHQHHQTHNRRPIYQANAPDNYPSSNYRHPSTTTEPSFVTTSNSSSDGCASSICYSYLIAIFSSFLVVLGIYLSLTRFSARFLFISLIGLLIEAVGACIYCISNIYSSKLTRRKQRIDSDEFILNAGGPIVRNLNLDGQASRPHTAAATYILDNHTLNPSNSTSNNNNNNEEHDTRPNGSTAINENTQVNPDTNETTREVDAISRPRDDVTIAIETNDDGQSGQSDAAAISNLQESTPDQLPHNHNYTQSPEAISGDFTSSTVLLIEPNVSNDPNEATENKMTRPKVASREEISSQRHGGDVEISATSQMNDDVTNNKSTGDTVDAGSNDRAATEPSPSCSRLIIVNYQDREQTMDLSQEQQPKLGGGLVATDAMDTSLALRKSSQHQGPSSRPNNVRRTLVVGLSGEEELIEIDEDDLDNMSIMPPPYESIATNTTTIAVTPSSSGQP